MHNTGCNTSLRVLKVSCHLTSNYRCMVVVSWGRMYGGEIKRKKVVGYRLDRELAWPGLGWVRGIRDQVQNI